MKKAVCLTISIALMLLLSSCMEREPMMYFFKDNDSELADARMEQVFNAIKEQDKYALKSFFSKKSLENVQDVDADIDILLSFIKGKVIDWHRDELPVVFDAIEYEGEIKQLTTWYFLNTDEQSYLILLVDYPIDTINPENAGLYSLSILRVEDEYKLVGAWEEWVTSGIYIFND